MAAEVIPAEVMAAEVIPAAVMAAVIPAVMAAVIPADIPADKWEATRTAIPVLSIPVGVRTLQDTATTVASGTIVATAITAIMAIMVGMVGMVGMVVATV